MLVQAEVNFLGRYSHPNLVKLLGYCCEDKDLLLVYEFMKKGSLDYCLFGSKSHATLLNSLILHKIPKKFPSYTFLFFCSYIISFFVLNMFSTHAEGSVQPLPWDIRLKVAIGMARGLAYLHTLEEPIIYRDFKSSNVLLDEVKFYKISRLLPRNK